MPYREGQIKFSTGTIKRGKISAPVQLLSTTNMLAYNAPNIPSATSSSTSSLQSPDESELSFSQHSFSSPITSPDESHAGSPVDAYQSTSYFPKRSATTTSHPRSSASSTSADAPMVPKRALSHTKRSHQELARQRSLKRASPPALHSVRSSPAIKTTPEFAQSEPHPFGKELAQVNEVVEEFGGIPLFEEEEMILSQKGLKKFSVHEYIMEIEDLYGSIFDDHLGPVGAGWV